MNKRLIIVSITNDVEAYPDDTEDNARFPHLVSYVEEGDGAQFVVDPDDPLNVFWPASEFFAMVPVTKFLVDSEELFDDSRAQGL